MSRQSRDQQFKKSFDDCMTNFTETYYPNTIAWELNDITKNKNLSSQHYSLTIPKKRISYTIDSHTIVETGIKEPSEVVEIEQDIPEIEDLNNYFNGYFGNYILKSDKDRVISFVSLVQVSRDYDENSDLSLKGVIVIQYYKSYLPFPSNFQNYEQLKEQNKHLEKENSDLNAILCDTRTIIEYKRDAEIRLRRKMKRNREEANQRLFETIEKMQANIRKFYIKQEEKEDCPVCYEKISNEKLMVPSCCHYICQDCHVKCETCPICREEYVKSNEELV